MAVTIDASGLVLLEQMVAILQADYQANPSAFTGQQAISATYKAGAEGAQASSGLCATAGNAPGTLTISSILQRVKALQLALEGLPQ
jgi:hypothetical protein